MQSIQDDDDSDFADDDCNDTSSVVAVCTPAPSASRSVATDGAVCKTIDKNSSKTYICGTRTPRFEAKFDSKTIYFDSLIENMPKKDLDVINCDKNEYQGGMKKKKKSRTKTN